MLFHLPHVLCTTDVVDEDVKYNNYGQEGGQLVMAAATAAAATTPTLTLLQWPWQQAGGSLFMW